MEKTQVTCILAFAVCFLYSCSTRQQTIEDTTLENVLIDSTVTETSASESDNGIIIHGSEIWVRDKPGNGEVIMTLNEGQHCKMIGKGPFEIIRGAGNIWLNIDYNGKRGWVFGAQTDYPFQAKPLRASTEDELWEKFKQQKKNSCSVTIQEFNKPGRETVEGGELVFVDSGSWMGTEVIPPDEFAVEGTLDGGSFAHYSRVRAVIGGIVVFTCETHQEGAAGFGARQELYIGIFNKDHFELYPESSFRGRIDQFGRVDNGMQLMLTRSDSGPGIAAFRTTSYDLFIVDPKALTIRCLNPDLGFLERFFIDDSQLDNGEIIIEDRSMRLSDDPLTLSLIERRSKRENGKTAPLDEFRKDYAWDKKNKKFIMD